MDGDKRQILPPATRSSKAQGKGRGPSGSSQRPGVYVAAVGNWVIPVHGVDRPLVAGLLSEDTCWCIAVDDWRYRRPAPWQLRRRSEWRAEKKVLEDKRLRIVAQAAEIGLRRAADPAPRRLGHSRTRD